MRLPLQVQQYLDAHHAPCEVLIHRQVEAPQQAAQAAYVPEEQLVRTVLLEDRRGPLLAVITVAHRLDLANLNRQLQRDLSPAARERARALFPDCDPRALPPLAAAYGVKAIVDPELYELAEVYFQPGLGTALLQMKGSDFRDLMADAWQGFRITEAGVRPRGESGPPRLDLKRRLREIHRLPAMPAMARRVLQVRANPYAGARELADVVELDPSLTAQIIRYARSPFFGYPGPVDSVQDAIARVLGYDLVMNIALGLASAAPFRIQHSGPLGLAAFWRQAVYCAALTQNLAKALPLESRPRPGLAYLAGLLHNFGYLVLGQLFQTEFFWLNRQAAGRGDTPVWELERAMLQTDHAELGEWLLTSWHLPPEVVTAVRHHHDPGYQGDYSLYPNLVLVANRLLATRGIGDEQAGGPPEAMLDRLRLSPEQPETILQAVLAAGHGLDAMAGHLAA